MADMADRGKYPSANELGRRDLFKLGAAAAAGLVAQRLGAAESVPSASSAPASKTAP